MFKEKVKHSKCIGEKWANNFACNVFCQMEKITEILTGVSLLSFVAIIAGLADVRFSSILAPP